MACPDALERIGNLAHRRSRPCGGDGALQQIALAALGARTERIERFPPRCRGALGTNALDPRDLRLAHGGVVDVQDVDIAGIVRHVSVDPDDDLLAAVHPRLTPRRGLLDAQLRHARRHRPGHATERLDLVDERPRRPGEARGQGLDVVRARERVHHPGDPGLLAQDELGVAGNARRRLGGQRERLVERVGVQRLRAAKGGGEGLDRGAHDVVVRVLAGKAHPRRLAMGAQHQ